MNSDIFGIIMAGGGGTRFWPLSRKSTPKQLLNLSGRDVMVNEAAHRLSLVTPYDNIYIVTNVAQTDSMRRVTAGSIDPAHILAEPSARNTAASIGYAAMRILKERGDGIMVITPSDAYIRDEQEFARILNVAVDAAQSTGKLVTIGITPTFAATGYGYIRMGGVQGACRQVLKFVEKPDEQRARAYLSDGGYVWNSGMFVWRASVIMQKFRELLPDIYADLQKIADSFGSAEEQKVLFEVYPKIRSISVDYGILERTDDILVVPGEFGWSDVGSWDMMGVLHKADGDGNILLGDALCLDCKNTTVFSDGRLVAAVGVSGLVVVETADAVLVCPKERAQDVKKIVDELKARGREELL